MKGKTAVSRLFWTFGCPGALRLSGRRLAPLLFLLFLGIWLFRFQLQKQDGQRRHRQIQGLGEAVHGDRLGFDDPVADSRPAEFGRVGAEHLGIGAEDRDADPVRLALNRSEVAENRQLPSLMIDAAEHNDTLRIIVVRNPGKIRPRKNRFPTAPRSPGKTG